MLHNAGGVLLFYFNYIKLCNKLNKSPSAVGEELGFTRSAVTGWSRGSIPRKASLQAIADYFNITVDELLNETEPQKPTPTGLPASGGVEVTPLEAELLAAYRRLSPAQRQALLALLGIES